MQSSRWCELVSWHHLGHIDCLASSTRGHRTLQLLVLVGDAKSVGYLTDLGVLPHGVALRRLLLSQEAGLRGA